MADLARLVLPVDPSSVLVVGTGGDSRPRRAYLNGEPSDDPVLRNGAAVQRLSGVAVSIAGVGVDGATLETTTPLESVVAGTIFRAEGAVECMVRADAKPGFGDRGPRGVLAVTVFVERLVPVGSAADLLRQPVAAAKRGGSPDA